MKRCRLIRIAFSVVMLPAASCSRQLDGRHILTAGSSLVFLLIASGCDSASSHALATSREADPAVVAAKLAGGWKEEREEGVHEADANLLALGVSPQDLPAYRAVQEGIERNVRFKHMHVTDVDLALYY